jgi:nicotinamide phosphoribosyltransferase
MNPFLLTDAYKISHPEQYPAGTEYVYSNITARKSRMEGVDGVVVFGVQYLIKEYLIDGFSRDFFNKPKSLVIGELREFFDEYFGPGSVDVQKYEDLHDLGYLPLEIKCLPEGAVCPIGVPFVTVINTDPKFYWLTNFIETLSQTVLWNCITCATIARQYRILLDGYAIETAGNTDFVQFQGHNFSMRGMSSVESGVTADAGHLIYFVGSDTLPGNVFLKRYYNASGLISCSVPATEHAVMCAGGKDDERETFRRLIQDTYPSGIISIVSDTWDLWKVLTEIAPSLRREVMSREGKVVFRPDSGDPVKILCGYRVCEIQQTLTEVLQAGQLELGAYDAALTADGAYIDEDLKQLSENEIKGCVQILDEQFGSTVNSCGYKELDPHVGLIYGDSITLSRCEDICSRLKEKGYASTNVVFGIGSYTYQYNTRDTFSIACKATWVTINGEAMNIYKSPVTDDGTKKSACGLLQVTGEPGSYKLNDMVSPEQEADSCLRRVFLNGTLCNEWSFHDIRETAKQSMLETVAH